MNQSKAFCLDFPEPMKLSRGMSSSLRVVFRPLRAQHYSDTVLISCDGLLIPVPLSAPLAAPRLQAPDGVEFGLVPARERFVRPLPIRNVGDAAVQFSWRVETPFSVLPAAGRLGAGQGMACQVAFAPEEAAAFTGSAACALDSGESVVVKVCAIYARKCCLGCLLGQQLGEEEGGGNSKLKQTLCTLGSPTVCKSQLAGAAKFPFLTLDSHSLDLGCVVVGRSASVQLRLGNHSPVEARFCVLPEDAAAAAGLPVDGRQVEEHVFDVVPSE